jgi:drug/metabolite transporter (DMT)-like permease
LLVGIGGILLFYLLSKGEAVSVTFPLIRVISLIVVASGGILLFSEPFSLKLLLGLAFSFLGIWFLLVK